MKEKTRKIVTGTAAITLVSALAIGGTFAYLTKITEKRANNFTFASTALDARLTEPKWDGVEDYEYDDEKKITYPIYGYIDDDDDKNTPDVPVYGYDDDDNPITDKKEIDDPWDIENNRKKNTDDDEPIPYGDKDSKDMVPGQVALKNPKITNTGGVSDEWVAAKITFVYATGDNKGMPLALTDMKKITDAIEIDYNADGEGATWDRATGDSTSTIQVFYYTKTLAKDEDPDDASIRGESTKPIFTQVRVKDSASTAQMQALEQMGGFVIYIEGFAIQDAIMETYNAETLKKYVRFETTDKNDIKKNVDEPGIISAFKSGLLTQNTTEAPAPVLDDEPTPLPAPADEDVSSEE